MVLTLKTENFILFANPEIETLALALQKNAESWQSLSRPAGFGQGEKRTISNKIRGDSIHWLERDELPSLDLQLEQWMRSLNENLFLGLSDWETHFAAYPPGAGYDRHVDQRTTEFGHRQAAFERVVSFVIYLNSGWQSDDGGELVIYSDSSDVLGVRIAPRLGQAVMFLSEGVQHEVLPSKRSRWSLTGWFLRSTLKDA